MLGDEPRQTTLAADALEERHGLGLGAEEQTSTRSDLENTTHELATDASAAIIGVDEDVRDRREKVAVGKQTHATDEAIAIPGTDVRGSRERRRRFVDSIVTRPDALAEYEEFGGSHAFSVSQFDLTERVEEVSINRRSRTRS
jgi:hypothetical protein